MLFLMSFIGKREVIFRLDFYSLVVNNLFMHILSVNFKGVFGEY